ncbi:MAG: hypothetical protein EBX26_06560 [Actinobacteria bacterium]|nr:hypothetical protein [Actinomycetota bacterium]
MFEMTPEDKNLDLVNIGIEGGDLEALYSLLENSKLPVRMPDWFLLEAPLASTMHWSIKQSGSLRT